MKRTLLLLAASVALAACDPDLTIPRAAVTPDSSAPSSNPTGSIMADGGSSPQADASTEGGTPDAGTAHIIDGANDFTSGETFTTTSALYKSYVTYDAATVYFGMSGPDVGSGLASKWVLIYVDGNPPSGGTTTGIGYDCGGACTSQQAVLPFNAGYHLRWKADDLYTDLRMWNGATWIDVGLVTSFAHAAQFFEASLPRAALGNPTRLKVHMFMLTEASGTEWTFAGTPAGSFTDGPGANTSPKNAAKWLELGLDEATAPNAFPVKP